MTNKMLAILAIVAMTIGLVSYATATSFHDHTPDCVHEAI